MDNSEKARVRWLDVKAAAHEGKQVFVVSDPEGITDRALVVSREVLLLLSLMDGSRTVRDIQEEYLRASGQLMYTDRIATIIETMDSHFMLHNRRYKDEVQRLRGEYDALPHREAFLAGRSYPGNEGELRDFLGPMMQEMQQAEGHDGVKGLIAPHIDYGRGMEVYRQAYSHFPARDNLLVVVFGTCHKFVPRLWSISLKDLVTPLGRVQVPKDVAERIRQHALLADYVDEWPHRNEHSIELQLPIIQLLAHECSFSVLSILTGSLHGCIADGRRLDEGEVPELIAALRDVLTGHDGPCIFIAAADLAHIGTQFGDDAVSRSVLEESQRRDRVLLDTMQRADSAAFFETVKAEGDRRRICGLAPIYFTLSMLKDVQGEIVGYRQWTDGESSVSFAGAVFRS
jgi:AmmeMemoRadiSam system protein B